VKKGKYSWFVVISAYFMFVLIVDAPKVVFSHFLRLYTFPINLLSDPNKDHQLGLIFSDGLILPLTGIIFCHYAAQTKNHWRLSCVFTVLQGTLEWVYLNLGYLHYYKWNIWLSVAIYFIGFRITAKYASRIMRYNPPVPYALRIAGATYTTTVWVGAVLGGELIRLYEWIPHIFKLHSAEDRFPDVAISWALALLSSLIVPEIHHKYRPMVFVIFAAIATAIYYVGYARGWLIYHSWNHLFTALRWFVPFGVVMWFDICESNHEVSGPQSSSGK